MSAQPVSTQRPLIVEHAARVRRVSIEWGISRLALGRLAPQGDSSLVTLRYEAVPELSERWTLLDPASGCTAAIPDPVTRQLTAPGVRNSGGRVHIHSPMLYAFVSIDHPDRPELLYARTPIFDQLGIAGGRYQPLSAAVER